MHLTRKKKLIMNKKLTTTNFLLFLNILFCFLFTCISLTFKKKKANKLSNTKKHNKEEFFFYLIFLQKVIF